MIRCLVPSPVGALTLVSDGLGLSGIYFETPKYPAPAAEPGEDDVLKSARVALERYFAGSPAAFTGPLSLQGTAFQKAVWQALRDIPHGSTTTYAALAARLRAPKAVRAVGGAVGRNPVSILIPCHRVLGTSGKLTGFAGGLARKKALLAIEGVSRASWTL